MEYLPAKVNYGKPHGKASYIRSLNSSSDSDNLKDLSDKDEKWEEFKIQDELSSVRKCNSSIKVVEDSKENHLKNLNSAYTQLCNGVEKIQSWKTSVELECKKKSKKLDEFNRVIESQRKVVYDLQMQNEKLSSQLNEEISQRVSVMEKFYFTKELCSALKRKFHELEDQFEEYKKVKENSDVGNEQKLKVIEDITKKFNSMCLECSERFNYLNDALTNERNTTLMLKNLCEQQSVNAEKEHKSFCNLIEKCQDELKATSEDLQNEKEKTIYLEQEKKEIMVKISELETKNKMNLKKLNEAEQEIKRVTDNKCEIENSFKSEVIKVNELNLKYKELEDLSNKQKTEFEEELIAMKTTNELLENSLNKIKEKAEEFEKKTESLTTTLFKTENKKECLELEVSKIKYEKEQLEDKLFNDAKVHDETICQLMMEQNILKVSLEDLQKELHIAICDKESISKLCSENEQKVSKITSDYQSAVLKIEDLTSLKKKYSLTLKKVEELENNLKLNSDLLVSKDLEIKEMNILKENYVKSENKVKELEDSLLLKSEELRLKNEELKEFCNLREKYAENEKKIKELEDTLLLKSKEIFLKEKAVEESNITKEENIAKAMNEINRLKSDMQLKEELIFLKESKIKELTIVAENYASALLKIQELEEDIHYRLNLLDSKEKLIIDMKAALSDKEIILEKLQYENFEMKDNLQKEKESVKVCLDCESLKDKLKEFENFEMTFNQTQEELNKQKGRADRIMKMLSETEDNFDDMRIKKEKQIINLNETIEALQLEIKVLKAQLKCNEDLKTENENLKRKIEETVLQNEGDMQRLKKENLKLKENNEVLKSQEILPQTDSDYNNISRKKAKNSVIAQENENDRKMEADSSHGDDVPIKKEIKATYPANNVKNMHQPIFKEIPKSSKRNGAEKRKNVWESGSSDSDCLEIVFDSKANGLMGFTSKPKTPGDVNRTPLSFRRPQLVPESKDNKGHNFADYQKSNENYLRITSLNKVSPKNTVDDSDFLKSKENTTQISFCSPSFIKRKIPAGKGAQSTPSERKFFKTPLKERESSFNKPQSNNLWC